MIKFPKTLYAIKSYGNDTDTKLWIGDTGTFIGPATFEIVDHKWCLNEDDAFEFAQKISNAYRSIVTFTIKFKPNPNKT